MKTATKRHASKNRATHRDGGFGGMAFSRNARTSASSWGLVVCASPGYMWKSTFLMPAVTSQTLVRHVMA